MPARLWWCDHEPGEPGNKLDRGRLSVFPCADIAGAEVPPEEVLERLWSLTTGGRPGIMPTHWKYPEPISETEYRYQVARLTWAQRNRPTDPALRPRREINPADLPLPDFTRENSI